MNRLSLITCARWETDHIFEWCSYHYMLGVDHIYLYCNDDDPKDLYSKVSIFCRGSRPKMTFLHFPFLGEQWKMYVHCLEMHKGSSKYLSFLDVDEFISLKKHKDINDFISEFDKTDWDAIFLNWVYFGNNFHETRPEGNVLENYTRRSKRISHQTKVIIKSKSVNVDFMKLDPVPFWHGIGVGTYNVFNSNLKYITPLGENFRFYYEKWWDLYHKNKNGPEIIEHEHKTLNSAYISHFFIKSKADFRRRMLRGTSGNFGFQTT